MAYHATTISTIRKYALRTKKDIHEASERNDGNLTEYEMGALDALSEIIDVLDLMEE